MLLCRWTAELLPCTKCRIILYKLLNLTCYCADEPLPSGPIKLRNDPADSSGSGSERLPAFVFAFGFGFAWGWTPGTASESSSRQPSWALVRHQRASPGAASSIFCWIISTKNVSRVDLCSSLSYKTMMGIRFCKAHQMIIPSRAPNRIIEEIPLIHSLFIMYSSSLPYVHRATSSVISTSGLSVFACAGCPRA